MKKILIITILTHLIFSVSYAQKENKQNSKWIYVWHTHDGDKLYFMGNPIAVEKDGVKIWMKMLWQPPKKGFAKKWQTRMLVKINCFTQKQMMLDMVIYDKNGIVISRDNKKEAESEWVDIIPDTIMDKAMNMICELFNNSM